ncbi:acyltransferase [Robertkochia solimangrovi]|nr:acyltransferase [Robertkochia solimangrovi]TRZ41283.1 acyltransferase [Robertkochia solimangrovi]
MTEKTLSTKPHFQILDALRGLAAITVVIFHILEAHAKNHNEQIVNHGYLAVDFFFVLSGFVIGYAYDDRWGKMSYKDFFKRRLIRLHPMVVIAMIIGAIFYYTQASVVFPGISEVPVWQLLLTMFVGFTLLPIPPSLDIRGWGEMHPLNGPAWTLFFEYLANILYALILRKLSNKILAVLLFVAGAALIHVAVFGPRGDLIGGWSLAPEQFLIGLTRLSYPFLAGLLVFRLIKPGKMKQGYLISSMLLLAILAFPRIGGEENLWQNGIYDSLSVILLFPLIVYIGASGSIKSERSVKFAKVLGGLSYPLYITHYPLIYWYFGYVYDNKLTLADAWPVGLGVLIAAITIGWLCLKLYDEPIRKRLKQRFL